MQHRIPAVPREPNMAIPKKSSAVQGQAGLFDTSPKSGGSTIGPSPLGDTVSINMYRLINNNMLGVKRFRS